MVDELFVGNKLAAGKIQTSDGTAIDLRDIRSPIVGFCSKGDNITPPQEATGWNLDLYESVEGIRNFGQTIVYTIHETVGHLGIFVSAGVARKEHGELSSNIDLIDTLPPGLYEAVLVDKTADTANPDLASGNWVMRCEARTLDDIRALGDNDAADDRCFEAAARISETNLALYRAFAQPFLRAFVSAPVADRLRQSHPLRLQYEWFTDANPLVAPVSRMATWVRENRSPVAPDNPFLVMQKCMSDGIIAALDAWRDMRDAWSGKMFFAICGSPALQAALGIESAAGRSRQLAPKSALHTELVRSRIAELRTHIAVGGVRQAVIRARLYAAMHRQAVDERRFEGNR